MLPYSCKVSKFQNLYFGLRAQLRIPARHELHTHARTEEISLLLMTRKPGEATRMSDKPRFLMWPKLLKICKEKRLVKSKK